MELPRKYPYNPRWQLIVFTFVAGAAWLILMESLEAGRPDVFSLCLGSVAIAGSVVLAVRRLTLKRLLVLSPETLTLPTGFLRARLVQIPHANIKAVWRTRLLWIFVLCLQTTQGKFEILPAFLPIQGSFAEIEEFLRTQVHLNRKT
jgi:hypothetical protein